MLKALIDRVTDEYKRARDEADAELRSLYVNSGVDRIVAMVPGVQGRVAKISYSPEEVRLEVDEDAFWSWVDQRYPEEAVEEEKTVTERYVRVAFRKLVLERIVWDTDVDAAVDPTTGEAVPFVRRIPAGAGKTTMTFERGGREKVSAAWRDGTLSTVDLLELTQ